MWPIDISRLSTDTKLALSHYALDNKANETRVIGGFEIDLSFPFKGKTTLFGSETTNDITPMISYDFTSKKKQASIPVFDTTDGIDGYLEHATLLSGERYNGIDRFVNENDITLSLQSIYKDKLDEDTKLVFKLAQRYYGDDEVVVILKMLILKVEENTPIYLHLLNCQLTILMLMLNYNMIQITFHYQKIELASLINHMQESLSR